MKSKLIQENIMIITLHSNFVVLDHDNHMTNNNMSFSEGMILINGRMKRQLVWMKIAYSQVPTHCTNNTSSDLTN